MKKKHSEKGETIMAMATIANIIWQATSEKGFDVARPDEYCDQDGVLHHFFLDVPMAGQTYRVLIMRPDFV